MFSLRVRFLEVNQHLKTLSASEFDAESCDFCGQIEANFDGHLVNDWFYEGDIDAKAIEAGSFSEEWILLWLQNLLDAVSALYTSKTATVPLVQSPGELRFISLGGILEVQLFIPAVKWDNHGKEVMEPEHIEWHTRGVELNDFAHNVIECAESTLNIISHEFPNLLESQAIQGFQETLTEAMRTHGGQVNAKLTAGGSWITEENCILGDEAGLLNLKQACEIALKRGEYYGGNLGEFIGVKKLPTEKFKEPAKDKPSSSPTSDILIAVGVIILVIFAVLGVVAVFNWIFN